ncbi:MAG TPA: exopolysaccharide biosynthesis protein [Tepidisphaeraceae bacterium]|jgi:hypothetical protein
MSNSTVDYASASPDPAHHSLVSAMDQIRTRSNGQPQTVQQIVEILKDRGIVVVLIILTMPFLFPIPTMGLSAPAGAALAVYGFCVALGREPWLPGFLLKRELSPRTIERLVSFGEKWARRVEKVLKPRLRVMNWSGINLLTGISLIINGILMSLPLPIPATNAIPAFAILLLLLGLLDRDGVFILAGLITSVVVWCIFGGLGYLVIKYGVGGAREWIGF